MTNVARDALGKLLIEKGFAPNDFLLDLNLTLTVPSEMELPAPWNLPSRLFRFPIEVSEARGEGRRIGLMHPRLLRDRCALTLFQFHQARRPYPVRRSTGLRHHL